LFPMFPVDGARASAARATKPTNVPIDRETPCNASRRQTRSSGTSR
jgi:Arc/MetJ family transcription regulator